MIGGRWTRARTGHAVPAERRGRPKAADAPDTRRRVVQVAQEQFGERGYAGVSMDQLATATGVNVRAIYHYFPSKRALFDSAAAATFEEYGNHVLTQVFVHDDLRGRLHGFVTVYRELYQHRRHLLAFLSVVLIEAIAAREGNAPVDDTAIASAQPIVVMNEQLVADALARGELSGTVTADAAIALLQTIGMGLGLASLDDATAFLPMLDALDLLIDGTLLGS
jgi:AcrR family transcriptional regulator